MLHTEPAFRTQMCSCSWGWSTTCGSRNLCAPLIFGCMDTFVCMHACMCNFCFVMMGLIAVWSCCAQIICKFFHGATWSSVSHACAVTTQIHRHYACEAAAWMTYDNARACQGLVCSSLPSDTCGTCLARKAVSFISIRLSCAPLLLRVCAHMRCFIHSAWYGGMIVMLVQTHCGGLHTWAGILQSVRCEFRFHSPQSHVVICNLFFVVSHGETHKLECMCACASLWFQT